jgi:hypothetical protein
MAAGGFLKTNPSPSRQENVAIMRFRRPRRIAGEDRPEFVPAPDLLRERLELPGGLRRHAAESQDLERLMVERVPVFMQRATKHMPGDVSSFFGDVSSFFGRRLFVLRRLNPKMVWPVLNPLHHERMDIVGARPIQPVAVRNLQTHVDHPMDECRRHRLDDGAVLRAIPGADNDRTLRRAVFTDPPLLNQAVEGFLNFVRARVELVKEQAIGLPSRDRQSNPTSSAKYYITTSRRNDPSGRTRLGRPHSPSGHYRTVTRLLPPRCVPLRRCPRTGRRADYAGGLLQTRAILNRDQARRSHRSERCFQAQPVTARSPAFCATGSGVGSWRLTAPGGRFPAGRARSKTPEPAPRRQRADAQATASAFSKPRRRLSRGRGSTLIWTNSPETQAWDRELCIATFPHARPSSKRFIGVR